MNTKGKTAWNRGIKFPHTQEWEAKRLTAVRAASEKKEYPKGYHRPKEHTAPMLKALSEFHLKNPELSRALSIANLPKDCIGEKNGNWKGGKTLASRGIRFTSGYLAWRNLVLKRDGFKCRLCGSLKKLTVHHIIPMCEYPILAILPMNGVTLCKQCHYDNDSVWKGERPKEHSISSPVALIFSIPHKFQAYPTCGNWQFTNNRVPVIFVSKEMGDDSAMLVAIHELVEVFLCQKAGITEQQVDDFDIAYEKNRIGGDDEPGDDPDAPYQRQHNIATGIERLLCAEIGMTWDAHAKNVEKLP